MKYIFGLALIIGLFSACIKNEKKFGTAQTQSSDLYASLMDNSAAYDSIFAQKLGSDDYGMKSYVIAFLKSGPNRSQDSTIAADLQKAHLQNIRKMAAAGKLVLAGPFPDTGEIRGIYIFNVETVEEAQALTATDPAIQAGRLVMELHPWYGTALLPILTPMSSRVEKSNWAK